MFAEYANELMYIGYAWFILGTASIFIVPVIGWVRLRFLVGLVLVVAALPPITITALNLFSASLATNLTDAIFWYIACFGWLGGFSSGLEQVLDARYEHYHTDFGESSA